MTRVKVIEGLPIVDATAPVTLSVTKRDIAKADPKQPGRCAVAMACRRTMHAIDVRVHLTRIYVKENNANWVRYETPGSLRSEIVAFDRGGTFEESDFILKPVGPTKKLGAEYYRNYRDRQYEETGKRKRSRPYHITVNVRGPAWGEV